MNDIKNLNEMEEILLKIRSRVILLKNIDTITYDGEIGEGIKQSAKDIFEDIDLCLNYCLNENLE